MAQLALASRSTVEWYEPRPEGMQLMLQQNPDSELCVKARPGFLRNWQTELEAVTRLGHAFAKDAPTLEKTHAYSENGVLKVLNRKKALQQIQTAKADQSAYDEVFNQNGVRRFAVAAFDSSNSHFLGVLALAEIYHFKHQGEPETILQQLQTILKS